MLAKPRLEETFQRYRAIQSRDPIACSALDCCVYGCNHGLAAPPEVMSLRWLALVLPLPGGLW